MTTEPVTQSQSTVLALLDQGGCLTVDQLARDAGLSTRRAQAAVAALCARGLVGKVAGGIFSGRYRISTRGRGARRACARVAR